MTTDQTRRDAIQADIVQRTQRAINNYAINSSRAITFTQAEITHLLALALQYLVVHRDSSYDRQINQSCVNKLGAP